MKKIRSFFAAFFSDKKRIVLFAVILAAVLAGVAAGLSFLLPKTVTGSWELTVNPEAQVAEDTPVTDTDRVYYVFDKPGRDGKGSWKICYDGGVEYYEYTLLKSNGVRKINLGSADLEYRITGSKLFGTAKMTFVYPATTDPETGEKKEAQEYVLEQRKAPDYSKMTYADFGTDVKLKGDWATNERSLTYYIYSLTYKETVSFADNGIMIIHYESEQLTLDRNLYYAYTTDGKTLTFSPVLDRETKYSVSYAFDENGNLTFTDDTTTESVFADAFFGDFTYYPPDKLPDPPTNADVSDTQPVE